jgi:hypothetical protein
MIEEHDLDDRLPFISVIHYGKEEYVGIIINQDNYVTSFYDFAAIVLQEERIKMIELGEMWWYESNHKIPISIFLRNWIEPFNYAIRTFSTHDVKIIVGPVVNISDMSDNKPKRRTVQLLCPSRT